ncbi:TraR/DksA C4-type zinc finger protein [Rhizobium paknamense]|uniref:RNA polymerase-binding transcription factor DksA n=1 Tax=Rhizobium paknamense TaxID=1206817 RepID=A0ABU0IAX8_9HYPH|nr:TraR/DksA C4-type zinc finger protein [Rhizobium paknamense]MDQ0454640.1 RNA polymerase-binding transcription factor DksA [Rhizobium paknamense]
MFSNVHFELAEERVERERDAKVAAARAALKKLGEMQCLDCGLAIAPERRLAYPAASRCLDCQIHVEREAIGR